MKKCQAGFIELVKEFVPANLLQPGFPGAEIDPENSGVPILFGRAHRSRVPVALLRPFLDGIVIRRRCAVAHVTTPFAICGG